MKEADLIVVLDEGRIVEQRRPRRAARARRRLRRPLPAAGARGRARGDLTDGRRRTRSARRTTPACSAGCGRTSGPTAASSGRALLLSPVQPGVQPGAAVSAQDRHRPLRRARTTRPGSRASRVIFVGGHRRRVRRRLRAVTTSRCWWRSAASPTCACAVFAHLQRLPMRFFDRNPVGKLVSRVTTDVDVLNEMFAAGAMTIVLDVLKLVGIVAFMLLDRLAAGAREPGRCCRRWRSRSTSSAAWRARTYRADPRAHRAHQRLPAGGHLRHAGHPALRARGRARSRSSTG